MNSRSLALLVFSGHLVWAGWAQHVTPRASHQSSTGSGSAASSTSRYGLPEYLNAPLRFEQNEGQLDKQTRFLSRGSRYNLFLTGDSAVFQVKNHGRDAGESDFRMTFPGANAGTSLSGVDLTKTESNYLIGNDSSQWHTHIKNYAQILYSGLYPGVDLVFYGNDDQLEYDLKVRPHASVKQIALNFEGLTDLEVDAGGDVKLTIGSQVITMRKPHVYQLDAVGKHQDVAASWHRIGKDRLGFEIPRYNRDQELVIDPAFSFPFATNLIDNNASYGKGIAVDAQGSTYITGETTSTGGLVSPPAFQTTNLSPTLGAAFVAKYDATGSLVYSTYVGGATSAQFSGDTETSGNALAVTAAGNAILAGYSDANNSLPVTVGGDGCTGSPITYCANGFLIELSADGTSEVLGTWVDANETNAIALDGSGNIYVAGASASLGVPGPGTVYQATFGGGDFDAFVAKYSNAGAQLWWTFVGGNATDIANGVAVDGSGNVYVAGTTIPGSAANSFPLKNPLMPTASGEDGFVFELSNDGTQLLFSTYLGGTATDNANAIAVNSKGAIVVTGTTQSTNFPTTAGALQTALCCTLTPTNLPFNAFVTEIAPGGASILYSGLLGGDGTTQGNGVVTDANNNIYVVGTIGTPASQQGNAPEGQFTIGSIDANLLNLGTNSIQNQCASVNECENAFILSIPELGNQILYFTYLGGSATDLGAAIAINPSTTCAALASPESAPCVYVAGSTTSGDFPRTDTSSLQGSEAGFIAEIPSIISPTCTPTESYAGFTVTIGVSCSTNFVAGVGNVNWGDGSTWTSVTLNGPNTPGTCNPSCSHTFSAGESGTASVTPTVSMTNTADTDTTYATPFPVVQLGPLTVALALNPPNAGLTTIQEPASSVSVHATITHASDTTVYTWSVNNIVGGNAAVGTITASDSTDATYVPPAGITQPLAITITAIANIDKTTASPALNLTVNPPIAVTLKPASVQPVQAGSGNITVVSQASTYASTPNVTWALSGTGCNGGPCGTLSSTGPSTQTVYTPPAALPSPASIVDTITATSAAAGGSQATAALAVTVTALPITIAINPTTATVIAAQSSPVQFTATVSGPSNKAVVWSVSGKGCNGGPCGTVSATGLYTPPSSPITNAPQTDTVTVTSAADATQTVSAIVTINNPIQVTITSPAPPQFAIEAMAGSTQQITAQVTGTTDTAVLWSLTGTGCNGAPCGTLSATGLYTAPASAATSVTDTIVATAHANPTRTAAIMAVVFPITGVTPPASVSVVPGQSATYTITLPPGTGDPINPLQLTCANLPNGTNCTFNPNPLPPGVTTFTVTVSTTSPTPAGAVQKPNGGVGVAAVLPFSFLLLFGAGWRRSRKRITQGVFLLGLIAVLAFGASSCGTGGSFGNNQQTSLQATPPGVYTISVIATPVVSANSNEPQPAAFTVTTLPLTVQ
ncbi:MAG: SBBP repeat-containing protein [Terracidiphilus sp.]